MRVMNSGCDSFVGLDPQLPLRATWKEGSGAFGPASRNGFGRLPCGEGRCLARAKRNTCGNTCRTCIGSYTSEFRLLYTSTPPEFSTNPFASPLQTRPMIISLERDRNDASGELTQAALQSSEPDRVWMRRHERWTSEATGMRLRYVFYASAPVHDCLD